MAAATDSTPAPARRLLRVAGPGQILTTADVLALAADAPQIAFVRQVDGTGLTLAAAAGRHARVLRQHDAGVLSGVPNGFLASIRLLGHRRVSRSVLPTPVRLRS